MNKQQLQQIKVVLKELKAEDITCFKIKDEYHETEKIIISTVRSTTHLRATANNIKLEAKRMNLTIIGYEGFGTNWAIIDMAFIVIHIMLKKSREFYNLDKLFK